MLRRLAAKLAVVAATSLLPRNSLFWERVSLSLRKNVSHCCWSQCGVWGQDLELPYLKQGEQRSYGL